MNEIFKWTEGMSVGVRELDEQHRHLFFLIDELIALAEEGPENSGDRLVFLMNGIINYNLYHLSTEEEHMEKFDCTSAGHLAAHDYYRNAIREKMKKAEGEIKKDGRRSRELFKELGIFAGHWHVEHILMLDKGYTGCFHEHGLY